MEPSIRRLEQSQREAVVFLGKVGVGISKEHLEAGQFSRYDCAFLLLDREDRFDGETHKLPETLCARIRFREATRKRARPMRSCSPFSGRIILPSAAFRARSRSSITV